MNPRQRRRNPLHAGILIAVLVAGCSLLHPSTTPASSVMERVGRQIRLKAPVALTAGAAKVEITPPVGTSLAGYTQRRGKPSTGIRDPLYVRAVALSDGEDTVVIVSADLWVLPNPLAERILQAIAAEQKIPRQAIILTTTHTHSGTGAIVKGFLYEQVFGAYNAKIEEGIAARLRWAVKQAVENQKPVTWGMASDEQLLQGSVENRATPGGLVDPGLAVLLLEGQDRQPNAVLVNAAVRATLMDSRDFRFSADFPGELCRLIEVTYPGAVCLFINGAAGDVRPRDTLGNAPEERIERFGRLLAEGTTGLINRIEAHAKADLAAWGGWFQLPPPQIRLGPIPIPSEIGQLMRPSSTYLNLAGLEDLVLIPLPAEMTAELGIRLKQRFTEQGLRPLLFGYANGYLGFAVTPEQYRAGSYEASMTWYGPNFGNLMVQDLRLLVSLYKSKRAGE